MNESEVLRQLAALGTAQNRKIYARHGVKGKMYGVSYANLEKLRKQLKTDHELARQLWATGNHDARVLAAMIADPHQATASEVDAWVKDLDNYVLTDAFVKFVSGSELAPKRMKRWTKTKGEWTGAAGWGILAHLAISDSTITDEELGEYLGAAEAGIHHAKNRVRHSMNGAVIAIGSRNARLEKQATATARRIGKVEVDHGETGCKTPDAVSYIRKAAERRRRRPGRAK